MTKLDTIEAENQRDDNQRQPEIMTWFSGNGRNTPFSKLAFSNHTNNWPTGLAAPSGPDQASTALAALGQGSFRSGLGLRSNSILNLHFFCSELRFFN